jgi:hypothetical protein
VTALDPSRASLAGGIVYMFQVAGGSVGLGLTTTVFVTASEDRLQKDLAGTRLDSGEVDTLHGALAGTESAAQILARFSRGTADRLLELIRDAFAAGMQWAFRLVAALALSACWSPSSTWGDRCCARARPPGRGPARALPLDAQPPRGV